MNDNYNNKKRIEAIQDKVNAERQLKKRNKDYNDLETRYNALLNDNHVLENIVKDLHARFEKGGNIITKNDNNQVTSLIEMQPISDYLPLQDLSSNEWIWSIAQIGKPLYAKFPFIEVQDRTLVINQDTLKKYKGAII